jgi:hypothetical protein
MLRLIGDCLAGGKAASIATNRIIHLHGIVITEFFAVVLTIT